MPKAKSGKSPATIDLSSVPGTWYLQWVYQMRDLHKSTLKAATKEEAIREGRKLLEKYRHLDEPHVIFISTDGSVRYSVDLR